MEVSGQLHAPTALTLGKDPGTHSVGRLDVFFFFSFYWHYNPLWILAFSVILFHSALSLHCFLHPFIPILCVSSSISKFHLFLGLPLILVPIGYHCKIFLGVLLSSIRITWPRQAILLFFINLTIVCVFSYFIQFVIHSDSQGSIFILHWTKDFFSIFYALIRLDVLERISISCPCRDSNLASA